MAHANDPGESRENISLKTGKNSYRLFSCSEDCLSGSKFISTSFGVLTAIITVALLIQIDYGDYQVVPHGSVATDSRECSAIGTSVLKDGGNAVDASIASAFCLAVVNPHKTGLDADGQLLIYNHRIRDMPIVIDFNSIDVTLSPVPRLVVALAYIHQQYGHLHWKKLVEPAAQLAKNGFLVPQMLVSAINNGHNSIKHLYGPLEAGQIITMEPLASTLNSIAQIPRKQLYSYITPYTQPVRMDASKSSFMNYNIYTSGAPTAGPMLAEILNRIEAINFTTADTVKAEYVHKLAEITQIVYSEFNISEHFHEGTASNIAAVDLNDIYVSLVTGMSQSFGSGEIKTAGYLLDAHKNPPYGRIPIVITQRNFVCGRRVILGARDVAVAAQIITTVLIGAKNATTGIEMPRYNILDERNIGLEDTRTPFFNNDVVQYLSTLGKLVQLPEPYSSCNIVEKTGDDLSSHSDSRGGGIASRF